MPNLDGMPTASEIILFSDSLATLLRGSYASMGAGAPSETTTMAALADIARSKIMGDGGSNPGLGSPILQSRLSAMINSLVKSCSYVDFFSRQAGLLISQLDTVVNSSLPSGWKFAPTTNQAHAIDMWMSRMNALDPSTPVTPASAGTLTAITDATGQLPNFTSGNCPRVFHTLVGSADYIESLPSPQATQIALFGGNNALQYQIAGTVPTGTTKVRMYRGYVAGGVGIAFWDQDVSVTSGSSYPAIKVTDNDYSLRIDIIPPSWMCCLMQTEFAALFGLAFGSAGSSFGQSIQQPFAMVTNGMLSPLNVALAPVNSLLGVGNVPASATFGSYVIGTGYTAGTIQSSNFATGNIQGFGGAGNGIRARCTSVLNAAGSATISYTYLAAATGQTVQTQTGVSATFSGTAVDSTAVFSVPAGRLIKSVSVTGVSGMTSGAFLVEAVQIR